MTIRPLALALTLAVVALPVSAAERYVAFGDSITEGIGDTQSPPGYAPKLQKLLKKGGLDVKVENWGLAGETTFEAMSRIDAALAGGADQLLLMEGTNDITLVDKGLTSIESVISNLEALGSRAKARGIPTLMGTVLPRPPKARRDRDNEFTRELNWEIYELTASKKRPFADVWARFNPFVDVDVFRTLYTGSLADGVGHPNNEGYEVIAQLFADQILGVDNLGPVPGRFAPYVDELTGVTEFEATLFESTNGAGINRKKTFFEVNGEVVATPLKSKSNKRRAMFRYAANRKALGCRVVLGFSGQDLADPPNVYSQLIWAYSVEGRVHLPADVDGDCTVDSLDLDQLTPAFGAVFGDLDYSVLLDFNSDDIIDGLDLAILASVFGSSSE